MRTETTKSTQIPHEPDISEEMRPTAENNEPNFHQQNRAWSTLKWFDRTAKTEAAFYTRFQTLPDEDVTFLKCFYNITEDRELFRMICKFWNVRIAELSRPTTGVT
jgi:hypothetical protein